MPAPSLGPESLNRELCDAASAGDLARLRSLLAAGAAPGGHFDAASARARVEASMRRADEYAPPVDFFAGLPAELRRELEESSKLHRQEELERCSSAPWSHEIPLFCAAETGCAACVQALLDAGAPIDARDSGGATALHHAGSVEVARLLVDAGCDIEATDHQECTPLAAAMFDGRAALPRIRALLACGADPNATHDRGYTVFMTAVGSMERDPEVLRALVEAGADPHAISELGFNAFHAAIDVPDAEAEVEASMRAVCSLLRELGVDIEHRNNAGHTPLARAITHGTATEVKVLCELGADPNATCPMHECGSDGCEATPRPLLHHAAAGRGVHPDRKTAILLEAGADPWAVDEGGFTALDLVVAQQCAEGDPDEETYSARYEAFQEALGELPAPRHAGDDRSRFLAEAVNAVRGIAERVTPAGAAAAEELEARWRQERIATIAALVAERKWREGEAPG